MLTDQELAGVRGTTGTYSIDTWRVFYAWRLNREISAEEVFDAHRRINPPICAVAGRLADLMRSEESWWRQGSRG